MGIKLYHNGEWVEFGGNAPTGSAAGTNKQVQFNDNGALAGANQLEFDKGDATDGSPAAKLTLKPNYSGSSTNGTYGGGDITSQSNNASDNYPYNRASVHADGGMEIMRRRTVSPEGGPYVDFKAQVVSGNEEDFDARVQMDYALEGGSITPTSTDYSAITFQTGGRGYYNTGNTQGNVTEKFRITKDGDFVCGITTHLGSAGTLNGGEVVKGGGIYNRVRYMGDPSKSDNENVSVTKDFFTLTSPHGASAGRLLMSVNGHHVSAAIVYDFVTYAGNTPGFAMAAPVAQASFGSYAFSATIVTSGTYSEIKTIRVTNTYTKNTGSTGTAVAGPSNPYVSMTMILGATSKGITVTRPT